MLSKQRMLDQIARVFESFGFGPLVTPAIEYAEILMGKYGDEGDKLLYPSRGQWRSRRRAQIRPHTVPFHESWR